MFSRTIRRLLNKQNFQGCILVKKQLVPKKNI